MRRSSLVVFVLFGSACGGGSSSTGDGGADGVDAPPSMCQPIGAQGQFLRRQGNPRLVAGAAFTDGKIDTALADPDVHWDGQRYHLYYGATHATSFTSNDGVPVIRHATSVDRQTWTVDDAPVLVPGTETDAWDGLFVGKPSVTIDPDAPADKRYLMVYAGAKRTFPFPGYTRLEHAIGAAFSADGVTFTRAGVVLTGAQIFDTAVGAIVSDPEVVYRDGQYHLWFSSFACAGTDCATVTEHGVSYAISGDGITWTEREAPVLSLLRASSNKASGGVAPSVIYDAPRCRWEMWLSNDAAGETDPQAVDYDNTAGVFRADSSDGRFWNLNYTRARDVTWSATQPGEALGLMAGFDVAQNGTGRLMLYVGFDDENVPAGATLPAGAGMQPGVMTLNVATRDLP